VTPVTPGTLVVSLWCAGTLGHFLLTDLWVRRYGLVEGSADRRFFMTMLAGMAGLSAALHVVAVTAGLGIPAVLTLLAVGHLAAWWRAPRPEPDPVIVASGETRWLEVAAVVTLSAIALGWVLAAGRTLEVSGTDAAHYHVPNAVNLALGASPFDLPPTSHLYPMGSSMLAAWFILPFGDALLTDLPMLPAFLLLAAGLFYLFRLTTGVSGLAWATWPVLALFSTPLFRSASLMSADLMFAASATALVATLYRLALDGRVSNASLLSTAAAAGLLLGVKTTGLVALTLFGGPTAVVVGLQLARRRASLDLRSIVWVAFLACVVLVSTGGIWLVRNWWVWGSPVVPNGLTVFGIEIFRGVPFERSTYLSVLGDLANDPDYPLGERMRHHVGEWLGPWYLATMLPLVLIPLDAVGAMLRRDLRAPVVRRLALVALTLGTLVPMLWLLAGAPWTSLEWTRGMALRYAQPWWALVPLTAFVGLFPASLPWYRRAWLALVGGGALAAWGVVLLQRSADLPFPPAPTLTTALVAAAVWAARAALPRRVRVQSVVGGVLAVSILFALWTSQTDLAARAGAEAARSARTPVEQVYAAAIAWEGQQGRGCAARRFFVTTRLDQPLGLQGVAFSNQVFYAAREVAVTATVDPLGRCDYIISSREVLKTPKGMDLVAAINPYGTTAEIAEATPFVLLGAR